MRPRVVEPLSSPPMTRSTLTRRAFLLRHFADQLTSIRFVSSSGTPLQQPAQHQRRASPRPPLPPCVCAGTASRRRARPSRFEPRPLNPHARVASVSRFPLSCADLQLRHALRVRCRASNRHTQHRRPLALRLTVARCVRRYLSTSNYDFSYGDAHRLQLAASASRLNAAPCRPQTAPRTSAPSATSRRR